MPIVVLPEVPNLIAKSSSLFIYIFFSLTILLVLVKENSEMDLEDFCSVVHRNS